MISETKKRAGLSVSCSLSKYGGESGSSSFIRFRSISTPNLLSADNGSISALGSKECHLSTNAPSALLVSPSRASILFMSSMTGIDSFPTFSRKPMFFSGSSTTSVTYSNTSASARADSEKFSIDSCSL